MGDTEVNLQRSGKITVFLAFLGAIQPTPIPLAGVHKLYVGQYGWGLVYMLLGATQVPRIACAAEGLWYLTGPMLTRLWSRLGAPPAPVSLDQTVGTVASSLREIEQLRQEGLLSEYEFEQKRRSLLEQIP